MAQVGVHLRACRPAVLVLDNVHARAMGHLRALFRLCVFVVTWNQNLLDETVSGYSDTSREAFAKVDITASQRRILDWFYQQKPGHAATRQQLVVHLGMPINCITPRITELLEAGRLESLPAVEGRHPLRLATKAAGLLPRQALELQTDRPAGISADALSRPDMVPAAPRIAHVLPPKFELSRESAKRIIDDPRNAFHADAVRALK